MDAWKHGIEVEKLNDFIDSYNKKYETSINSLFSQILFELTKPYDEKAAKSFIEISSTLDNIRNENILDICPKCEKNAKWSAWVDSETKRKVCPNCVDPENWKKAMEQAFPYGLPDNWD